MASYMFTYLNMAGEGVIKEIDLNSVDPTLNPYVDRERIVAALNGFRALTDTITVNVDDGDDIRSLFSLGNSIESARDELAECELLIEQIELAMEQESNAGSDSRTAVTEDDRAVVDVRTTLLNAIPVSDVVLCDDFTNKGKPCKNAPMHGDTKCGPHRTKANKEAAMPEQQQLNIVDFIVAGTGSRQIQLASPERKAALLDYLRMRLNLAKEKYGDRLVIMSGMAEGFDKALALVALELGIRLHCVIPNKGYADYYWGRNSLTGRNMMAEFDSIIERAEKVVYVMEDVHGATGAGVYYNAETNSMSWNRNEGRHSNMVRNDYMVATADAFLVYDPSSAGTSDAFASIRRSGKGYQLVPLI